MKRAADRERIRSVKRVTPMPIPALAPVLSGVLGLFGGLVGVLVGVFVTEVARGTENVEAGEAGEDVEV